MDRRLIGILDALQRLGQKFAGVEITRYNLNGQGMAFRDNAAVMDLLQDEGVEVLPIVVFDGQVVKKGEYPSYAELEGYVSEKTA